jgi:hypothetical protein
VRFHLLAARIGDVGSVAESDVARPAERGQTEPDLRDHGVTRVARHAPKPAVRHCVHPSALGSVSILNVDPSIRVCPYCGDPPGLGVFCGACGRNLADVARLPASAAWNDRKADATAAFLEAMRAAGNPGATEVPTAKRSAFRRARSLRGWVVRPVDREDFEAPRRYVPGLVLTVERQYHRLDSELRGWGQRNFPHYVHTASPDPVDPLLDERLRDELSAVRAANGVGDAPASSAGSSRSAGPTPSSRSPSASTPRSS